MKTKNGLLFLVFLISKVCYSLGVVTSYNFTFLCHNASRYNSIGNYIRDIYFCNGDNDCNDGEDEHLGCERGKSHSCGRGKFACDSGQCKNITARCNTIKDCQDGTDEQNCGDEIHVKNCTREDKFLCKDGLRCLGIEFTCDERCNCFDCSDENENCSKQDNDLLKNCPHAYFETANGPRCFCRSDNSSSTLCNGIKSCEYKHAMRSGNYIDCDQRCIELNLRKQCSCYEDYEPWNGTFGAKCRTTKDFAILYSNENEIKLLNNTFLKTSTILRGIDNCTMLTAANDYVYYATLTENKKGSIFKSSINFGKPEKLIETDFAITSMAVDYVTNNVYFTGDGSLSVCTSDGKICTELKCCDVNFVILAPKSGWMYYMQERFDNPAYDCQNRFSLMRSNMDGSNETIHSSQCFTFNAFMEIDESKSVVHVLDSYFSDELRLYRISVDSDFEQEESLHFNYLSTNPFSRMSFHDNDIFYTMRGAPGIFYFANMTNNYRLYLTIRDERFVYLNESSTSNVTDVHVYNAAIQRGNINPCEKSSCSGLCLLKPEVHPSRYFLSQTCLCDGFTPSKDDPWCSTSSHAVVWVISCISLLTILCITGYVFKKRNWHRYFHW